MKADVYLQLILIANFSNKHSTYKRLSSMKLLVNFLIFHFHREHKINFTDERARGKLTMKTSLKQATIKNYFSF